jgi:glutathione synthase/RimK-type ligase-like ATP-grasp enzyme
MNTYILRRRKLGKGSCLAIKKNLKEIYNKDITILRNDINQITERTGYERDLLIRWGCTDSTTVGIVINKAEHIHAVNDKSRCRRQLQDNGISVPMSFFNKEDAIQYLHGVGQGQKLIGRRQFHHQGRHIVCVNHPDGVRMDNSSNYWSEYIPKEHEYRVFTFFGRVTIVAEKIPTDHSRIAWNNFGGGSTFVNVRWDNWPIKACVEALKAANLIGIDFSGVDVMTLGDKVYILELNSAHSLTSEYRQKTFSKCLNWLIDKCENGRPDHYQFPERIRKYRDIILPYLVENDGSV